MELIDIIEKLEARINNYWSFYTVVIVALVGWVLSKDEKLMKETGWILSAGMTLFFFMNLSVLYPTTKRIRLFEKELNSIALNEEGLSQDLVEHLSKPFILHRSNATLITHLTMDFLVLFFIYASVVWGLDVVHTQ